MLKRFLFAPLALALASCSPWTANYVPATGWHGDWQPRFYESWYGSQLKAMGERPLFTRVDDVRSTSFRLLVLPNYQPAYSYRIEMPEPGKAILYWAILDGAGGYAPGSLDQQDHRPLKALEYAAFQRALAAATLPLQSREKQEPEGPQYTPEGDEIITIELHCTHYVFELASKTDRSYVQRRCEPDEPALRDLIASVRSLHPLGTE